MDADADAMIDWSSQTNWTIVSGSLRNCLTFQSSLSVLEEDATTVDFTSNSSPLVLHSPSSDSAPCEIKISFAEKHEIRQVYVRSTARVYEIYTTPNLKSNNEYLCTVRCGVAVRDDEVLCAPSIQEIASSPAAGSNKELGEENIKNEDDWVEVKVPDSPAQDGRIIPLQANSHINSTQDSQDFFEATAEIDDANPCISVTLRLLSLQSKGCVYVDEIYIFGDPVDSADFESQESHNENSSGSSLMAMFLPTIMQLSKTTGLSHLNAGRTEKRSFSEDNLEEAHPSNSIIKTPLKGKASITDPQDVKLKEEKGGWVGPSQPDTLSQVAGKDSDLTAVPSQAGKMENNHNVVPSQIAEVDNKCSVVPIQIAKAECNGRPVPLQVATSESSHGDSLGGNVQRALDQLVSRMDRIEEICLGFQEKMVMPMSTIEVRLQRVEQQLDTLTKKLQSSEPSCCRISAPDTSCIESDAKSSDNGLGYTVSRATESDKVDSNEEVVSPDDISDSENTIQLLPGLVVTAPDFLDVEDEEDNASGEEMNASNDKGKPSIDNALFSALAKLVSSLSSESPKDAKGLTVKAPEFLNEDDDEHEGNDEIEENDSVHLTYSEKTHHNQVLISSDISLESGEKVDRNSDDKLSEETAQEMHHNQVLISSDISLESGEKVDRNSVDKLSEDTAQEAEECDKVCSAVGDGHNPRMGSNNFEEYKSGIIDGHKFDGMPSNLSGISNELQDSLIDSGSSIAQEGPSARTDIEVAKEVPKKASHEDIIENVLGFSLPSSVVDFETSLLDVKFVSQRSLAIDPFFEAFLVDPPNTNSGDPSVEESNDDIPMKEQVKVIGDVSVQGLSNLVSVDDDDLVQPPSENHCTQEKGSPTLVTLPVNIEGDNNKPEDHKRKHDQISASSLI